MKIGILGSGNVGGTLGSRWAQAGHQVHFGSRDPAAEKVRDLVARGGENAVAGGIAEAAAAGDVVVLSTPWSAVEDVLNLAGDLSGKILIDCINPLAGDLSGLDTGVHQSATHRVAELAPAAHVVKAFNTASVATMADPDYDGQPATMFYCGDDAEAKEKVAQLAGELGFEPVDAGPLRIAPHLEHLAMLYIHLAVFEGWGSKCAFKIMKRTQA